MIKKHLKIYSPAIKSKEPTEAFTDHYLAVENVFRDIYVAEK